MLDLSGQRFGRLVAITEAERQGRHRRFLCQCDCGDTTVVTMNSLRRGAIRSCGCLSRELLSSRATVHGMYGSRTYYSWQSMIRRCCSERDANYPIYGGRGIVVCERWRSSFQHFFDDMGERPVGKTLDRIDVNGNYEPSNCRWASTREQRQNQRRHTLSMDEAARVRELRAATGWGPNRIAKHLGISAAAANGVIYLGNLAP